ncbi:hypothetical protein BH160DRAFT_1126 [Burkholderia sp. H160]|nr:hypothetical protein BH160DRAFT_1126 [Burkholderia sp. H160]
MIQIGGDYQRINGCDHELFTIIALDAKGVPNRRLTFRDAADLLADAAQNVQDRFATPGSHDEALTGAVSHPMKAA